MKSVNIPFQACFATMPLTALFLHEAVGIPLLLVLITLIVYSNVYFLWGVSTLNSISKKNRLPPTETDVVMSQRRNVDRLSIWIPYFIAALINILALFFVFNAYIEGVQVGILALVSIPTGLAVTVILVLLHGYLMIASLGFLFFGAPLWVYLLLR